MTNADSAWQTGSGPRGTTGARPAVFLNGAPSKLHWGQHQRAKDLDRGYDTWGGGSNPLPTSQGVWRALRAPPAGFGAELRPPQGFPLFSALRMASWHYNIVNCRLSCSHCGQDPRASLAYAAGVPVTPNSDCSRSSSMPLLTASNAAERSRPINDFWSRAVDWIIAGYPPVFRVHVKCCIRALAVNAKIARSSDSVFAV